MTPDSRMNGQALAEISPLQKPKLELEKIVTNLSNPKTHWETMIESLINLRALAAFHQDVLGSKATEVTSLAIRNCQNLRSKVSGAAIETVRDLFRFLKKALVPNLEQAIKALLVEAGKENMFQREKIEKCLEEIIETMAASTMGSKTLVALNPHRTSKNVTVRTMTARFTYDTIERMGPGKALSETRDTTERVFPAIISAISDASQDVRYWGRKMISLLSQHSDFNRLAERNLSANDARQVIDETAKIRSKGVGEKPSSARRSLSGRVSNRGSSRPTGATRASRSGPAHFDENLKEDLKQAKSSNTSNAIKMKALASITDCLQTGGNLGSELANASDLVCSLIRSAAVGNYQEALRVAPLLLPQIKHDPVLLPNLLAATAERLGTAGKAQNMANDLIDQICEEGEVTSLLAPIANRIQVAAVGRPKLAERLAEICSDISHARPKVVQKYGLVALWPTMRDHRCSHQAKVLAEVMYTVIGEKLFDFARKEKLDAEVAALLDFRL